MNPLDIKVFQDHLNERHADYQTLLLLSRNGLTGTRGGLGRSALHYAAAYDDVPSVQALCAQGLNVNARADGGEPPLFDALTRSMLQTLIAAGADLNAQDHLGHTLMHRKACEGDAVFLGWLIEAGASVETIDHEGNTALHTAAWLGDPDTVTVLIKAGSPLRRLNHDGHTVLDIAVQSGCQNVVTLVHDAMQASLESSQSPSWLNAMVRAAQATVLPELTPPAAA